MTIYDKLKSDLLTARKHRSDAVALLSTLVGEATAIGKNDGNRLPTDDEVIALTKKFIKGVKETRAAMLTQQSDHALASCAKADYELSILSQYVPSEMSEAALSDAINQLIIELHITSVRDTGKVMKALKECHGGSFNGAVASKLIKQLLTQ